jgi:hypothetical protein
MTCHQTSPWCQHLKCCLWPHYHSLLNHAFYKHIYLLWQYITHTFLDLAARCWANTSTDEDKDLWGNQTLHISKCWRILSKIFWGKEVNWARQRHIQRHEEPACWQAVNWLPDPQSRTLLWEWLHSFQNEFLFNTQGIYYTTRAISDLISAEVKQQLDLFVKQRSDTTSLTHHWKDVQVIAEHKQSKSKASNLYCFNWAGTCVMCSSPITHGFSLWNYDEAVGVWSFKSLQLKQVQYSWGTWAIHSGYHWIPWWVTKSWV